jgi:hypothetical protein
VWAVIGSSFTALLLRMEPIGSPETSVTSYQRTQILRSLAEPSQRPATKSYVKPEAAITVFELLMMGGVSPETC